MAGETRGSEAPRREAKMISVVVQRRATGGGRHQMSRQNRRPQPWPNQCAGGGGAPVPSSGAFAGRHVRASEKNWAPAAAGAGRREGERQRGGARKINDLAGLTYKLPTTKTGGEGGQPPASGAGCICWRKGVRSKACVIKASDGGTAGRVLPRYPIMLVRRERRKNTGGGRCRERAAAGRGGWAGGGCAGRRGVRGQALEEGGARLSEEPGHFSRAWELQSSSSNLPQRQLAVFVSRHQQLTAARR